MAWVPAVGAASLYEDLSIGCQGQPCGHAKCGEQSSGFRHHHRFPVLSSEFQNGLVQPSTFYLKSQQRGPRPASQGDCHRCGVGRASSTDPELIRWRRPGPNTRAKRTPWSTTWSSQGPARSACS
ncbi:uncharacterized protein STAUR_1511 [Stigmatella aurantiaca DW4/3-1]|uniref:Uncharacterized protein n=1 Tax=Stigmatella aurantiaca (strain DW4/3-1) TaxID=378806 RepID=E3FMB6_STIAD|nr:uncharacterized protein STAUR_1511 [Stigmatella aurantiaca DW4/3-1]